MPDLSGKVAIVTGAASGIGKTTAETLARHGASVVVAGHSMAGAEEVAADIRAQGGQAIAVGVDVTDEEQVKAMVGAAVTEFGGLDCLHNNAAATKMHRDSRRGERSHRGMGRDHGREPARTVLRLQVRHPRDAEAGRRRPSSTPRPPPA